MADKKTSDETSGAPIAKGDLHRIARSGDNYKLTSEEIFCETLTVIAFTAKATAGNLIAGRYYKVTGVGAGQTVMVLAYSSSGYTNINHEGVNTSGASGSLYIFEETTALTTIRGQLDSWANLSLGIAKPNVPSIGTIFTPAYYGGSSGLSGSEGWIYSQTFGGAYQRDNAAAQLIYSTFRNCTIYIDPTSGGISNSYIQNVNINLLNGASLSNCTIIGDARQSTGAVTYTFDGVFLNGATIIVGEFSTAEMDLRNGVDYNDLTQTLTLPANCEWVGRFNLADFTGTEMLTYIDGVTNSYTNDHTPVKFWNISGGNQILTTHINDPASSSAMGELMFPHHHGTNDDLHTIYSYLKGKYDINANLWVITDFIDYN